MAMQYDVKSGAAANLFNVPAAMVVAQEAYKMLVSRLDAPEPIEPDTGE